MNVVNKVSVQMYVMSLVVVVFFNKLSCSPVYINFYTLAHLIVDILLLTFTSSYIANHKTSTEQNYQFGKTCVHIYIISYPTSQIVHV